MNSISRIAPKLLAHNFKCICLRKMCTNNLSDLKFETIAVSSPSPFVYHVQLNRPNKLNAMNQKMWMEIEKCFETLHENPECRSIVLSGSGRIFSAGLDLNDLSTNLEQFHKIKDIARKCKFLYKEIKMRQHNLSTLEICNKPVIAAIHSGCVGGAVNLVVAADIRLCTNDVWFQIKEVDLGMAASDGILQRLPKVIGSESLARELCLTGRKMMADEAKSCGFVSKVLDNKERMMEEALKLAEFIAKKSPVAIQVTKRALIYARDHSVQEGLDQIALWNQTMLQSEDFMKAVSGQLTKDENVGFTKF